MPQITSSGVLIVARKAIGRLPFDADLVENFTDAMEYLKSRTPSILVFGYEPHGEFQNFCRFVEESSPQVLWILECDGLPSEDLVACNNSGRLHDVIDNLNDVTLEAKLSSALEVSGERAQRLHLMRLFEETALHLERLSAELEARVQKRSKDLRKSMNTLEQTKVRLESFHQVLLGIHHAESVFEMEQVLNESLKRSMGIEWVRVRFANQSSLKHTAGAHMIAIEIPCLVEENHLKARQAGDSAHREVLFCKKEGQKFSPAEIDFLHELSEALALALSRLSKLEQAETVKAQWQATFDSIPHPLCLVTVDFEILKLNLAFQQACPGQSFNDLLGKNCFKIFFGAAVQVPSETTGQPNLSPFTFRASRPGSGHDETEFYEVIGENLGLTHDGQKVRLILIRSITENVRYERRILESSKLAELGVIGSSIAHELNNPLGGMLSFLQLILMELPEGDPINAEIRAMEKAVLRCRDIIQNLLSFARKQNLTSVSQIDLWEVVERAVKLIELQSKSKGISIDIRRDGPANVIAGTNALTQALCNILQNSIDAIGEKLKLDPLFPGKIQIQMGEIKDRIQLRLSDNGTGIRPEDQTRIFNPLFTTRDPGAYDGMGLTTAYTIISEHHGSLEIMSQTGSGTTAIITLPTTT